MMEKAIFIQFEKTKTVHIKCYKNMSSYNDQIILIMYYKIYF
jgi:hypothetical protein